MAINQAFLLNDIESDLQDYGSYEVSAGSFLERALFDSMVDVDGFHQWDHRIAQGAITTVSGTLTGYAVPSDFAGLALEEKTNKYWAYDAYGVPPPISDGLYGRRYPINYNRVSETIEFYEDPGEGSRTFTYLTRTTVVADLANWPDKAWLKKALRFRACFYATHKTDDLKDVALNFWNFSEELMKRELRLQSKAKSRPDTRTLLDINGNPMYYSFSGEL